MITNMKGGRMTWMMRKLEKEHDRNKCASCCWCCVKYFMFYLSPAKIILILSVHHTGTGHRCLDTGLGIMNGSRFWTQSRTLFILDPLFIIFHENILSNLTINYLYFADNSEWVRDEDEDVSISILIRAVRTCCRFDENDILVFCFRRMDKDNLYPDDFSKLVWFRWDNF